MKIISLVSPSFRSPWGIIWYNLCLKEDTNENPLNLKVGLRSTCKDKCGSNWNPSVHVVQQHHVKITSTLRTNGWCFNIAQFYSLSFLSHFGLHNSPCQIWFECVLGTVALDLNFHLFCFNTLWDIGHITCGIPQGSVLGPVLYSLHTSDMPNTITLGTTYRYADDTTIYCTGKSIDVVTEKLNKANELYLWCPNNLLTPHPSKCGAVIMSRGVFQGSINSFTIGTNKVKWVSKTHLLGVNLDNKLDWSKHVLEVRKSFVALPTKTCSNGFISLGQLP